MEAYKVELMPIHEIVESLFALLIIEPSQLNNRLENCGLRFSAIPKVLTIKVGTNYFIQALKIVSNIIKQGCRK